MGDPGKLGVSTPAFLYKVQSHAYRNVNFVVFLNVNDLHLLGVLVFDCVPRCNV